MVSTARNSWWRQVSATATGIGLFYLVWHFVLAPTQYLDTADLNRQIGVEVTRQMSAPITVTCPDRIPMLKDTISDCTAYDGYERRIVRMTQNDSAGHFTFELTHQSPPVESGSYN